MGTRQFQVLEKKHLSGSSTLKLIHKVIGEDSRDAKIAWLDISSLCT